jgi:hypothetical protein
MATANGTRSAPTGPARTAGYARRAAPWVRPWLNWDRGRFQRRLHVEAMLEDPLIQFILTLLAGPVYSARLEITAPDAHVQAWAARQFRRLWETALPRLLLDVLAWGSAGGEVTLRDEGGLLSIGDVCDVHCLDRRPVLEGGRLAGVNVYRVPGGPEPVELRRPGSWFWLRNGGGHGEPWGWPRIAGCWRPWNERWSPKGLADSLRLYGFRQAFQGYRLYRPVGTQLVGGVQVPNADFADELLAKLETGGDISLPSDSDEQGNRQWDLKEGQPAGNPEFLVSRDDKLDKLYYLGAGIPPEVGEAAEVGGGWSGRAHPFLSFLMSEDQLVATVARGLDEDLVRPAATLNFGPGVQYEVKPVSLVPRPPEGEKPKGKSQGAVDAQPPGDAGPGALLQPPGQRQTPPAALSADAATSPPGA